MRCLGEGSSRDRRQAAEIAAVVARHFELGRDFPKAIHIWARQPRARREGSAHARPPITCPALWNWCRICRRSSGHDTSKLLLQRAWAWRASGDFLDSLQDLSAVVAHAAENGHVREEVNALVDLSRFLSSTSIDARACLLPNRPLSRAGRSTTPRSALCPGNVANLKLMLCGWDRENADLAEHASALITGEQDLSMRLRRCSMEMVLEFLRDELSGLL